MERICTPDPRELPGGSQSLPPSRLSHGHHHGPVHRESLTGPQCQCLPEGTAFFSLFSVGAGRALPEVKAARPNSPWLPSSLVKCKPSAWLQGPRISAVSFLPSSSSHTSSRRHAGPWPSGLRMAFLGLEAATSAWLVRPCSSLSLAPGARSNRPLTGPLISVHPKSVFAGPLQLGAGGQQAPPLGCVCQASSTALNT